MAMLEGILRSGRAATLGWPRRVGRVAAKRWTPATIATTSAQRHAFSTSSVRRAEPPGDDATWGLLRVNETRLLETLHATSAWGTGARWGPGPTETGMARAALSDADAAARNWFRATAAALGCNVVVDAVGNIWAVRPGRRAGPPVCAGSHLDTQPAGGRYDGVLGVVAGVEMLRVLHEHGVETEYPVGVVNWTNEEGARFPYSMMGSGVWAGALPLERAYALRSVTGDGATLKSELDRIGYRGATPAHPESLPMAAHFELHIEQGPVLEAELATIGVVQGVQAYKWFTIDIEGRDAHTGTTPLDSRSDALLLASEFIMSSRIAALVHGALASTGRLTLTPGSTNTIPGHVQLSLDLRAATLETVEELERTLRERLDSLAHNNGGVSSGRFEVRWRTDSETPATVFHPATIACVREAAAAVLGPRAAAAGVIRDITSGAGHDSVHTSRVCPTSMIFVPCRDGVSHHPAEYASPADCAAGANVLMQSILRYDQQRRA